LIRTLKYRPEFPTKPFVDLAAARTWVAGFTAWYNGVHLHSAIRFVTPDERHAGKDATILAKRHAVYEAAKAKNPARWTSSTRKWTPVDEVYLNPAEHQSKRSDAPARGCVAERGAKGGALADRGSHGADDINAAAAVEDGARVALDASVDATRTPRATAHATHRVARRAAIASSTRCAPGAPSRARQRPDNATTRTTPTARTTTTRASIVDDKHYASRGHAQARDPSRALDAHA